MYKEENEKHKDDFIKRLKIFICGSIALATLLGLKAQYIAYYIGNHIEKISPLYCLTVLTVISIILFLITHLLIYKFIQKQKKFDPYIIINSIVGIYVSSFSLFVMIMWWG